MNLKWKWIVTSACGCGLLAPGIVVPASAQKAPMYSYVANWEIAREKFKEYETQKGSTEALMKKHLANGDIVAYGDDATIVHRPGEPTHDVWWSSMSWAGMLRLLEAIKATGTANQPVFASAKHEDKIYVARYYNWKPGSFKDGYTRVTSWTLKPTAPDNAVEQIAKNFIVPMCEKLLSDGAIYEYEIDEEAIHGSDPGKFSIIMIAKGPEGLDKASAALAAALKSSPLVIPTMGSWVNVSLHRDDLASTTGTYK